MHSDTTLLHEEIARLPLEKIGKALSYIRYLITEDDALFISEKEEEELHRRWLSNDFIDSSEMLAKIKRIPQ